MLYGVIQIVFQSFFSEIKKLDPQIETSPFSHHSHTLSGNYYSLFSV